MATQSIYKPGDPPPTGYFQWHDWAAVQDKAGYRQRPCAGCGRYLFPRSLAMTTYYLHRLTPLHEWQVMPCLSTSNTTATIFPIEGETISLPDVERYGQAQAEADRRNGKMEGEQGVLGI